VVQKNEEEELSCFERIRARRETRNRNHSDLRNARHSDLECRTKLQFLLPFLDKKSECPLDRPRAAKPDCKSMRCCVSMIAERKPLADMEEEETYTEFLRYCRYMPVGYWKVW
jgi:hypothetical protein